MLNMMKKPYYILAIPVLVCLFLPSCKMRPKDAERLRIEADTGELKSMEMLAVHGGDLITQDERNHYLAQEGRRWWDKWRVQNGNIYTTACKIDSQWEFAV